MLEPPKTDENVKPGRYLQRL